MRFDDRRRRAEERFAEYLALREVGQAGDFEVWVREHPDLADELRALRQSWSRVDARIKKAARGLSRSIFGSRGSEPATPQPRRRLADVVHEGDLLGDFRLACRIGEGGMGEVWEAEQVSLRRRVALKLLPIERMDDVGVAFFEREAKAGARARHPAIVAIYDAGVTDGLHWIAQELVPGGRTLGAFVFEARKRERPAAYFEQVAELFAQIAVGLAAAHDAGVVHRDLTPKNILLSTDGRPKILDFGLARLVGEPGISGTGDVRGTLNYMSPEQVRGERELDLRTDVFSLGAVLYELLTLQRAFQGDSDGEVIEKIKSVDPPPARALDSEVPVELSVICARMLEKRREARFASMRDVAAELVRFLSFRPLLSRPPTWRERAHKWMLRNPTATAIGAGAVVLALLAALLVHEVRDRRKAQWDAAIRDAQLAIEGGHLDRAARAVERANGIFGNEPTGNLLLAAAHASRGQYRESQEQLADARGRGFRPDDAALETGLDHYGFGLYLMTGEGLDGYAQAAQHFRAAIRLDETLAGACFPLYQVLVSVGAQETARQPLTELASRLKPVDPFEAVVRALLHEIDGNHAGAIEGLTELGRRPGIDADRLRELRVARYLGRNQLALGRLDDAEASLRRAIADFPGDGASWLNLARVLGLRIVTDPRSPDVAAWLAEARGLVETGGTLGPNRVEAARARATIALLGFQIALQAGRDATGSQRQVEDALAELRGLNPHDPFLAQVQGELAYCQANLVADQGDGAGAIELFERCLAADPAHVEARVALAQQLSLAGRMAEADRQLAAAQAIFADAEGSAVVAWRRHEDAVVWRHAALVWRFGTASRLGDLETASICRTAFVEELEAGIPIQPAELVTFAEFLACAPEASRDCALARKLLADHDLARAFVGQPLEDAFNETIATIEECCR